MAYENCLDVKLMFERVFQILPPVWLFLNSFS